MLNTVYQLVRPRQFEAAFEDLPLAGIRTLVRPRYLSICNADQRYYQGKRAQDVLRRKLPMALIHEGVGQVVYDSTGTYRPGEKVIFIPNTPCEEDPVIAENYLRSSRFRGSSMNGLMQEYVETAPDRLVRLPEGMNELTASFTEMVSVCYHAVSRFTRIAHTRREQIGVWGDGNMGYLTALLLKTRFPECRVFVFGVTESKLNDFSFADETFLVSHIPEGLAIDHGFECVGGNASGQAIDQIIDRIRPEGAIALLGVSEDRVPVNTRMVLEKGLRLFGTSRSGRQDFVELLELYKTQPKTLSYLEKLIGGVLPVRGIGDMKAAFEMDIHKIMGKTIMVWDS